MVNRISLMQDKRINSTSALMKFLERIRRERGLSQNAMAKFLGLATSTYVHYEEAAEGVRLDRLAAMRKKLGVSWEKLGEYIDAELKQGKKVLEE